MKIINHEEKSNFTLVARRSGADCTKNLWELIISAEVGQAVHVSRDQWKRKSMISNNDSIKKTGKVVSIRTLEDDQGWLIFVTGSASVSSKEIFGSL